MDREKVGRERRERQDMEREATKGWDTYIIFTTNNRTVDSEIRNSMITKCNKSV